MLPPASPSVACFYSAPVAWNYSAVDTAGSQALGYTTEGEDHALKSYWAVPADVLEDDDRLHEWAERAYQAALKSGRT